MENKSPANLLISFDFELGWGVIENGRWIVRERLGVYERLRDVFPSLVSALDEREITADWASVGAMGQAKSEHEFSHLPDAYQVKINRALSESKESSFDGRDLLDLVANSRYQNVAIHGYSHITLDRADLGGDSTIEAEIQKAQDALYKYDAVTKTLVFPENRACSHAPLVSSGISTVRLGPRKPFKSFKIGNRVSSLAKPATSSYGCFGSTEDILCWTGSALFKPRNESVLSAHYLKYLRRSIVRNLRLGRDQCIWVHPFNFSEYPQLVEEFNLLLESATLLRDSGEISIRAM